MNNNIKLLDQITILSFLIGIYSLYIAIINLDMNNQQSNELKEILHYLEKHLQDQDNHLKEQDNLFEDLSNHLASQDRQLENITKGG